MENPMDRECQQSGHRVRKSQLLDNTSFIFKANSEVWVADSHTDIDDDGSL